MSCVLYIVAPLGLEAGDVVVDLLAAFPSLKMLDVSLGFLLFPVKKFSRIFLMIDVSCIALYDALTDSMAKIGDYFLAAPESPFVTLKQGSVIHIALCVCSFSLLSLTLEGYHREITCSRITIPAEYRAESNMENRNKRIIEYLRTLARSNASKSLVCQWLVPFTIDVSRPL